MTFTLITNAYDEKDSARRAEYGFCLESNLALTCIERVVVVHEGRDLYIGPKHPKLVVEELGHRGTFREHFARATRFGSGTQVVLSNADIYFDDTLNLASQILARKPRALLCLARWDKSEDGSERMIELGDSHDAWIFQVPFALHAEFPLGVPGCDGRLAWLARLAGIQLLNPARSIHAHHCHKSGRRNYTEADRLRGPYHWVVAAELKDCI